MVAMLLSVLLGQEKVKLATVCEALANAQRFGTARVGVLGRLYCPASL
jgi:hypothetical protein